MCEEPQPQMPLSTSVGATRGRIVNSSLPRNPNHAPRFPQFLRDNQSTKKGPHENPNHRLYRTRRHRPNARSPTRRPHRLPPNPPPAPPRNQSAPPKASNVNWKSRHRRTWRSRRWRRRRRKSRQAPPSPMAAGLRNAKQLLRSSRVDTTRAPGPGPSQNVRPSSRPSLCLGHRLLRQTAADRNAHRIQPTRQRFSKWNRKRMGIRSHQSRSTRHPRSPRTLRRNPLQTRRRPSPQMLRPFQFGVGGKNRHRQTMDELDHPRRRNRHPPVRARKTPNITGAIKTWSSPQPVTNEQFTKNPRCHPPSPRALPPRPPSPSACSSAKMAEALLLSSQRVLPRPNSKKLNHQFLHPDLATALAAILQT